MVGKRFGRKTEYHTRIHSKEDLSEALGPNQLLIPMYSIRVGIGGIEEGSEVQIYSFINFGICSPISRPNWVEFKQTKRPDSGCLGDTAIDFSPML